MNVWQRFRKFGNKMGSPERRTLTAVSLLVLLIAIPVTLTLVQSQQDIRQEAANRNRNNNNNNNYRQSGYGTNNYSQSHYANSNKNPIYTPTPVQACPLDALQCPDGTTVGRTGPNCEFAACPGGPTATPTPTPTEGCAEDPTLEGCEAENEGDFSDFCSFLPIFCSGGTNNGSNEDDDEEDDEDDDEGGNNNPTPTSKAGVPTAIPTGSTSAGTYVLPPVIFLAGDANIDNEINILDYEIIRSCFNDESTCSDPLFFGSDLNDDSFVNLFDLNLFLRELSTHRAL